MEAFRIARGPDGREGIFQTETEREIQNGQGKPIIAQIYIVIFMDEPSFRVMLRKEPEGGYTVIVPSLPGCITYGEDVEEAMKMAKEAIQLYVESLIEDGEEIPTDEDTLEYSIRVKAYA